MSDLTKAMTAFIPQLRRYGWSLTNDRHRADDLVQDCLLRAIQRRESFREGTNLRAWLFTIMHNIFIDQVRRNNKMGIQASIDVADGYMSAAPNQEGRVALRELQRALDALPLDQRATLILVGLEGLSYEEAAEVTGVAVGTVKSRMSRAREALRALTAASSEELPCDASKEKSWIGRAERIPGRVSRSAAPRRDLEGRESRSGAVCEPAGVR